MPDGQVHSVEEETPRLRRKLWKHRATTTAGKSVGDSLCDGGVCGAEEGNREDGEHRVSSTIRLIATMACSSVGGVGSFSPTRGRTRKEASRERLPHGGRGRDGKYHSDDRQIPLLREYSDGKGEHAQLRDNRCPVGTFSLLAGIRGDPHERDRLFRHATRKQKPSDGHESDLSRFSDGKR